MDRAQYWHKSYGKIGNRPLDEIRRAANNSLLVSAMGEGFRTQKYVENAANKALGFVAGERAACLASIDAQTIAEITFAWRVEMTLAKANREFIVMQLAYERTKGC